MILFDVPTNSTSFSTGKKCNPVCYRKLTAAVSAFLTYHIRRVQDAATCNLQDRNMFQRKIAVFSDVTP